MQAGDDICVQHVVLSDHGDGRGVGSAGKGLRHYFNPVQIMKLCEIVKTDHTDPQVIDDVSAFVKKTGKVGVPCGDT